MAADRQARGAPRTQKAAASVKPTVHDAPATGPMAYAPAFSPRAGASPLTRAAVLSLHRTVGNHAVQRLLEARRRSEPTTERPAPDRSGMHEAPMTPDVEASIRQASAAGQALPDAVRQPMESQFQADFSAVRIHTDSRADRLNRALQAHAFTTGQHIFFRQGTYSPWGRQGQALIAHELTHVVQQSAMNTPLVQRAVGFEFETNWLVQGPGANPPQMPKGEEIYADAANGFQMTGDTVGTDKNDIEFIIAPPFEESAAGLRQLNTTMQALRAYCGNLLGLVGHANIQGPPLHPYVKNSMQNVVITPPADGAMQATPQATIGVRLDRTVPLLRELSRDTGDAKSELLGLAARQIFNASQLARYADLVEGTTTTWSLNDPNRPTYRPSESMKGLVALILQYLLRGARVPNQDPYSQAFSYAKAMTILMARTDFAGLFQMLPEHEKEYYIAHPRHWVTMVLSTANLSPTGNVIERGLKGARPTYKRDGSIKKPGKVIPIPVKREDWLKGMLQGRDILTQAYVRLRHQGQDVEFSRSFGSLGARTDPVGPYNWYQGAVLELREVKSEMDYRDWEQFAIDVFTYVWALNNYDPAFNGPAPTYQKTATPLRGIRP